MQHPWDRRLGVWWIADDQPDAMAIVESPSGTRTYAGLAGNAHQLVHALRAEGLAPGDPVAVMLTNDVDIIEISLACHEAGFYFLPLNTYLTEAEVTAIIDSSNSAACFVHETYGSVIEARTPGENTRCKFFSVGTIEGYRSITELRAAHPTTTPTGRLPGALFSYTSGTTGKPKGIRRKMPTGDPSEVFNTNALFGRAFDYRPFEGPHLVSTGMFHGGSHSFYMAALNVGHGLVVMGKFDAEGALSRIDKYKITTAYMVPTQFHRLLRLPPEVRGRYDVSSLHSVVHSAAPCPRELKQQMFDWWGPVIWETYGGMEGAATIAKPQRWLEKPGTVGRAIAGVKVQILDDDGNELAAGQVGNIYYRTVDSFQYHGDGDGTQQAFKGKSFSIGDVGYLDEDGYLFISDRIKDMIITGGVNVYPQEVEAVLSAHPGVADVAVIGIPDADWGEQIKAVVEPAAGYDPTVEFEAALIEWCKERLATYKCPRTVDFRTSLPRTEAGKRYKRLLRDEYWAETGRNV
jgi:long-chain acyl-CoA synthetase